MTNPAESTLDTAEVTQTSAELLREAAARMREQHGPAHEHVMWAAMADWLEVASRIVESEDRDHCGPGQTTKAALAVARAYLGRQS